MLNLLSDVTFKNVIRLMNHPKKNRTFNFKPMKTMNLIRVLTLVLVFTTVCSLSVLAGKPELATPIHIHKILKESIKYPELAIRHGCCGIVDVTFMLNDQGTLVIKSMSTDNEEIAQSVKKQLQDITFTDLKPEYNQQYKVRITFKLV